MFTWFSCNPLRACQWMFDLESGWDPLFQPGYQIIWPSKFPYDPENPPFQTISLPAGIYPQGLNYSERLNCPTLSLTEGKSLTDNWAVSTPSPPSN